MSFNRETDNFRTFGRAKGRRLTPHMQAVWDSTFSSLKWDIDAPLPAGELWLEIGFGGAEHLLWQALEALPDNTLSKIFILFPDPWPKTRHHKRRLLRSKFIAELHRVLKPDGELRFASDIIHYVNWTLSRLKRHGGWEFTHIESSDWRVRGKDWPGTRYEAKAGREGRPCHYFKFKKAMSLLRQALAPMPKGPASLNSAAHMCFARPLSTKAYRAG